MGNSISAYVRNSRTTLDEVMSDIRNGTNQDSGNIFVFDRNERLKVTVSTNKYLLYRVFATIQKDDARVIQEMVSSSQAPADVKMIIILQDRRIEKLFIFEGQLIIPPSIQQLQSLSNLQICNLNLVEMPDEMKNLRSLKEFNLVSLKVRLLPAFIWTFKNLEALILNDLPIDLIPPSIGQLKKLEVLGLSDLKNLPNLPKEIWNLTNLKVLDLSELMIRSLPPCIGQLSNLEELYLNDTKQLSILPEEIGNLTKLKVLDLEDSRIESLPDATAMLADLWYLNLELTYMYESDFLHMLAERHHFLSSLGTDEYLPEMPHCTLALNRARCFIGSFFSPDYKYAKLIPKIWPHILYNTAKVRDWKCSPSSYYPSWRIDCSYQIHRPDAIYLALEMGRAQFIQLVLDNRGADNAE